MLSLIQTKTPILFSIPEAARLAREAWQIIHEWQAYFQTQKSTFK